MVDGHGHFLAGVASILLAAGFAEAARRADNIAWGIAFALSAAALRTGQISSAKSGQSQISEWSQRRVEQVKVAGEDTPAKLLADVAELKAADAN
jgi:hypothetical protein